MDSLTLAQELKQLHNDRSKYAEIESMLSVSESTYIAKYLPMPASKPIHTIVPATKKPLKAQTIKIVVSGIISLIMLFLVISFYAQAIGYKNLWEDPGEEYEAWLNNIQYAQSEDDLKDDWKAVEEDWQKHGVKVNWDLITEEILDKYLIDSAGAFDSSMSSLLHSNWQDNNTKGAFLVVPTLIVIVVLVFFIKSYKKLKEIYNNQVVKNNNLQQQNESNKKYNETVLPVLIAERERKLPGVREEYATGIASLKKKKEQLKQTIDMRASLLPEYYQKHALEIAMILERGRADTLKEAINIYEEDKRAGQILIEEKRRAAEEERHRIQMEAAALRAAEAAEKAARAAQATQTAQAYKSSAPKSAPTPKNEPYKVVTFYHFKGNPDTVGVNVISNMNNVYAAKKLMMTTYGKTATDIDFTTSEKKNAPYFDGRNAN